MAPTSDYGPDTALLVVDVQNDFAHPEGSLYVEGGEQIVEPVNDEVRAARAADATVAFTQDWHPPETPHFVTGGGTWPVHCVRGTWGAELHRGLLVDGDVVLRKGTGGEDGYSAFTLVDPESGGTSSTGLAALLDARSVSDAVVVGLAADVCVRATALDAREAGLDTEVLWPLTRAVEMEEGDAARARTELEDAGVRVVDGG